jgi:uncharacterized protein DUF481/ChrR-like protein with cupin domain
MLSGGTGTTAALASGFAFLVLVMPGSASFAQARAERPVRVVADSVQGPLLVTPSTIRWIQQEPGVEVALLSGDPGKKDSPFVFRVRYAAGHALRPHWHTVDEHVTVLAGVFNIGMGDRWDSTAMHAMRAGSYMFLGRREPHFFRVEGQTVLQVHGIGPFETIFLDSSTVSLAAPPATVTERAPPRSRARRAARLWRRTAGFNYALSRGNSDASDITVSGGTSRTGSKSKFQLRSRWRRGSRNGTSTSRQFASELRFDTKIAVTTVSSNAPSFLQELVYETDESQKLDDRVIVNAGLSLPIAHVGANLLSLEAGGGVTRERYAGSPTKIRNTGLLRLNSSQRLFGAASATQQITAIPDFDLSGRYRFTGDANLQAPLSKLVSLRMVVSSRYDTHPQPQIKRHDLTVQSGIGVEF